MREMVGNGLALDVISYSEAISACGKAHQWEKALELVREMVWQGLALDVIRYSASISA